jgi:hypothetical protein
MQRTTPASFIQRRRSPLRLSASCRSIVLGSLLTMVIPMATLSASSPDSREVVDAAERDTIVAAARAPAEKELDAPLRLGVHNVTSENDWAFVMADLEDPSGKPFDYSKSPRAKEAEQGLVSHRYAALLRRRNGAWTIVATRVGPTDPAWLAWSEKYGAPKSLFATSD